MDRARDNPVYKSDKHDIFVLEITLSKNKGSERIGEIEVIL